MPRCAFFILCARAVGPSAGTITFGTDLCSPSGANAFYNDSLIRCLVPAGEGTNVQVKVTKDGQSRCLPSARAHDQCSSLLLMSEGLHSRTRCPVFIDPPVCFLLLLRSAAASIDYRAPTVRSVSPSNGGTAGGFPITIAGSNFGSHNYQLPT